MTSDRITAAVAVIVLCLALALIASTPPALPACEEDQVLVGAGDFEMGKWTAYECGPSLDDFVEGG